MSDTILKIKGLNKTLGKKQILHSIDMECYSGEVYGFLGPNGAGKTTTIKIAVGLLQLDEGEISINGKDIRKDFEGAMANVGGIVENPEMYKYLSGMENLRQYARMREGVTEERIKEVVELVRLSNRINDKVSKYSLGMRQRLGVAQAILHRPKLLILDEPTNGLDPQGIVRMRELILKLNHEKKITVLISSHILDELSKLATHYGFIDGGRIVEEISAKELNDKCRRCIKVTVSDIRAFSRVMDKLRLTYVVSDDSTAQIYDKISISRLAEALASEKCELIAVSETEESLESHFIKLIGGGQNE